MNGAGTQKPRRWPIVAIVVALVVIALAVQLPRTTLLATLVVLAALWVVRRCGYRLVSVKAQRIIASMPQG